MNKPDKIIKRARQLLPKVKTRKELLKKLGKEFHIAPSTVSFYFCQEKFKTGFKPGSKVLPKKLKDYLDAQHELFEETLKDFYRFILLKPRYSRELIAQYSSSSLIKYYRELRERGFPIQRTRIGKTMIYYTATKREIAFKRIQEDFPKRATTMIRPILNGFHDRAEQIREKYQ